jgi:hypothetical protein
MPLGTYGVCRVGDTSEYESTGGVALALTLIELTSNVVLAVIAPACLATVARGHYLFHRRLRKVLQHSGQVDVHVQLRAVSHVYARRIGPGPV